MFTARVFFLIFAICSHAFPNSSNTLKLLEKTYKLYKQGNYIDAVKSVDPLTKNAQTKKTALYWKAILLSKLQEYDQANEVFQEAIKFSDLPEDIYYEYGQSLFASDDLRAARKAFARSYKKKFRQGKSLYYIAHSSQELNDLERALKYYQKIDNNFQAEADLRQAANYQMAEIIFEQNKENKNVKKALKNLVIPQFKKAAKIARTSSLATDIRQRISEIKRKYSLGGPVMINGKKLPEKKFNLKFIQSSKYDDNVTQEADKATIKASNKDSFVFDASVRGSYRFDINNQLTTTPEVYLQTIRYLEDQNQDVYTNNSHNYSIKMGNAFEYFFEKYKATAHLDFEFSETYRDVHNTRVYNFYEQEIKVTFGHDISFFKFGDTSFNVKMAETTSYLDSQDSTTLSFGLIQSALLGKVNFLIFSFNHDNIDVADSDDSTNTFLFRIDWLRFKLIEKLTLKLGLGVTLTDTKSQESVRGLEKLVSPSIKLSRKFKKKYEASFGYTYSKQYSDDKTNFTYSKNELALNFEVAF